MPVVSQGTPAPAPQIKTKPTCEIFAYPYRESDPTPVLTSGQVVAKPDVVHLHWTSLDIDIYSMLLSIPETIPIVWTLHDMNLLTGGCHYTCGCEKFKTACYECPQLEVSEVDPCKAAFEIKRELLAPRNIHVVANSSWLCSEAKKSALLRSAASIQTIHYGMDLSVFRPVDKQIARSELGLPDQAPIICFGADRITNPRKGLTELVQALRLLASSGKAPRLITFGKNENLPDLGLNCTHFGKVHDVQKQVLIYAAADVFVIPSLQEAFGLTALEAMACGTPVAGFATGGIPDMVVPGETGLLARTKDVAGLAQALGYLLEHPAERQYMRDMGLKLVQENHDLQNQASKYVNLYKCILGRPDQ